MHILNKEIRGNNRNVKGNNNKKTQQVKINKN